jgi:hypothetical protein
MEHRRYFKAAQGRRHFAQRCDSLLVAESSPASFLADGLPAEKGEVMNNNLIRMRYLCKAAALLAQDLMESDPENYEVGYSFENAIIAAHDIFPEISMEQIRNAVK